MVVCVAGVLVFGFGSYGMVLFWWVFMWIVFAEL